MSSKRQTDLVLLCVDFPLTVGELHGFVAIDFYPDDCAVRKQVLFNPVGKDILDGLIRKDDFLGPIRIMFLCLIAAKRAS